MFENGLHALWQSMGIANLEWGQVLMILVGAGLIFLAIRKGFEPLLLVPIGFGGILANIPGAGRHVGRAKAQGGEYSRRSGRSVQ